MKNTSPNNDGSHSQKNNTTQETAFSLLEEASAMQKSASADWWLNSGGKVYLGGETIKTIQGELEKDDYWREKYYNYNASETDDGYHPQNIFRLVTKQKYTNFSQEMHFMIKRYILSNDLHRAASNGVLFFHHYQDGDNLYYAGIRVDGYAVIKKKIHGKYITMDSQGVYDNVKYHRDTKPNLIPENKWIGLKSEIINNDAASVSLKLYIDKNNTGKWQLVAQATDDGYSYGGDAILSPGYAGIRTDFMDAEFKNYSAREL